MLIPETVIANCYHYCYGDAVTLYKTRFQADCHET